MRYNLVAGGVALPWAHFFGGALPWLVSWLVYRGHGVLRVLTWREAASFWRGEARSPWTRPLDARRGITHTPKLG
mgnify:CR=1 FL=1